MSIRPLKHPKNPLFSKIAAKQIYFWPYSIKGSYLEYKKPHGADGHWTLAWHQNFYESVSNATTATTPAATVFRVKYKFFQLLHHLFCCWIDSFLDIVLLHKEVFNLAAQNVGIWPQKQIILFKSQMPSFFKQNISFFSWGCTESLDKSNYWKEN